MGVYSYTKLQTEYHDKWSNMVIAPIHQAQLDHAAKRIIAGKEKYQKLQVETGVPWYFIGILHYRESDCNFGTHLHNGDSLKRRTVQVPAGRPRIAPPGSPPFEFDYSAQDALAYEGFKGQADWSIEHMAYRFEQYNGWGYRYRNCPSPYVWSYSNQYRCGKYVADHDFDPNVVDTQIGTMPLLKTVAAMENIDLEAMSLPQTLPPPSIDVVPKRSPKAHIPRPSDRQMNKVSRKHWWTSIMQHIIGLFGGGAAVVKAVDVEKLDAAKPHIDLIKSFAIDYGFWFGMAIVLALLGYFAYQRKLMKDDVQEGRAAPSGGEPNNGVGNAGPSA